MDWIAVDTQDDLATLEEAVCWEDSEVIEYHGGRFNQPHFPNDVSRSGYSHPDIHVLMSADARAPYLELAFIHCDHLCADVWQGFYVAGRVDSLKRVELTSPSGDLRLRCARLVYRWLEDVDIRKSFYGGPGHAER